MAFGGYIMNINSSLYADFKSFDGKSYATGLVRPKTTALFFDKIWYPSDMPEFNNIPDSIKYIERTPSQISSKAKKYIYDKSREAFEEYLSQNVDLLEKYIEIIRCQEKGVNDNTSSLDAESNITAMITAMEDVLNKPIPYQEYDARNVLMPDGEWINWRPKDAYFSSYYRNRGIRAAVLRLRTIDHINIVPIYFDYTDFEKYLKNNKISYYIVPERTRREALRKEFTKETSSFDVVEACIDSVPIIVEENLSWNQVEEIRRDKASIEKLSRFFRWANTDFTDKSRSEISDILNKELDDYQFALKKHGISTTIGGVTTFLSGTATLVSAMSTTPVDFTMACLTFTTGVLAYSTQSAFNLLECNRNPVAYIYDVTKKAKSHR